MGEGYSWVPPGLSPARVEEYMRQLPPTKVIVLDVVLMVEEIFVIVVVVGGRWGWILCQIVIKCNKNNKIASPGSQSGF